MTKRKIQPNLTRTKRLRQATHERREREKQELRQLILQAAGDLFLEQGYEGFSLRHVAERIGYSPGTIYLHFEDKDDVLFRVADEGFIEFGQRLAVAAASTDDPAERLRALGKAYIEFGFSKPAHYQLMFMQRPEFLMKKPGKNLEPHISSFHTLQQAVEVAMAAGVIRQGNPETTSHAIWATVHGIVALGICMPDFFDKTRFQETIDICRNLIMDGLRPT